MNDRELDVIMESAEKEFYSENGVGIDVLNKIAGTCINEIRGMPSLNDSDKTVVQKYETLLKKHESEPFIATLIDSIADKLHKLGVGNMDSRKFLLKLCHASTKSEKYGPLMLVFADAVLGERYDNYTGENIINDVLNESKWKKLMQEVDGIEIPVKDVVKSFVKLCLLVLFIAVLVRFVIGYRKYLIAKRELKHVKEAYRRLRWEMHPDIKVEE